MSLTAEPVEQSSDFHPLRIGFLRWQCRVRQISMRDHQGRPDRSIVADITLKDDVEPMGSVVTLISKLPPFSKTPEMQYMVKRTFDPAERQKQALQLFCETYYQRAGEFSDILTATFQTNSKKAERIRAAGTCLLHFEAYNQSFDLRCKIWKLSRKNAFYQSTWWHNHLFNPDMSLDAVILGFEPDWTQSKADPAFG